VWKDISEFYLNVHAVGLSHEAVIEIMVGILGVMMAAMSVLTVLVSLVFAGMGFYGYKAIEEKSVSASEAKASQIAKEKVEEELERFRSQAQGLALSLSQPPPEKKKRPGKVSPGKKTTDAALGSARESDDDH
jgi:hypothetical protein